MAYCLFLVDWMLISPKVKKLNIGGKIKRNQAKRDEMKHMNAATSTVQANMSETKMK